MDSPEHLTRSIDNTLQVTERGYMTPALLKRSEVVALVGLGSTSIWRLEKKGEFPARKQLSPGRVAWSFAEVQEWIASRVTLLVPVLVA